MQLKAQTSEINSPCFHETFPPAVLMRIECDKPPTRPNIPMVAWAASKFGKSKNRAEKIPATPSKTATPHPSIERKSKETVPGNFAFTLFAYIFTALFFGLCIIFALLAYRYHKSLYQWIAKFDNKDTRSI